jgi:MSHA pilin protein MshD
MLAMGRNSRGFTLVEMIVTIVVIGVSLAGVLAAFNTVVKSSADPLIDKQMVSIAEAGMEATMLRNFDDILSTNTCFACPTGYTWAIVVTPGVTWEGIPNAKRVSVTVSSGAKTFQLTNYRTNYAP